MSAIIKIRKTANAEGSKYVGLTAKYADRLQAIPFLVSSGVVPEEDKEKHPYTIFRRLVDKKYISCDVTKGSAKEVLTFEQAYQNNNIEEIEDAVADANDDMNDKPESEFGVFETAQEHAEEALKGMVGEKMVEDTKKQMQSNTAQMLQQSYASASQSVEGLDALGALLAPSVSKFVQPNLELTASIIDEKVKQAVANIKPDKLTITINAVEVGTVDRQHHAFGDLLINIAAGINTFMVGTAGSGKTTAAHNVARALGIEFSAMSVGAQTTESKIFGYMDAHSNYRPTEFRKRYEEGGVFLFDELDAGNAGVLTSINAALANDFCAFPDGMVKRHDKFICVAAGNTYGRGADRMFVGRNQLDAATLDRFAVLEWNYDEELELEIAGNRSWTREVQRMRARAFDAKLRVIISPRASIMGAKLLAAGMTEAKVKEQLIFKGCDENTRNILNGTKTA